MSTVFDFKAMFQAHVDANQKVWDHDRSSTLGASEAFGCLRKAWFDKKGEDAGYKPDADFSQSWGAMERGNVMEEHWVVPVLETQMPAGTKFHFGSGEDQVTYVYGPNSATPDGLYTGCSRDALSMYGIEDIESDCFMVEIKSIDPRSNLTEEKAQHHGQVQQQLGVIRSMTEYKPMYAVIIYINASFYDEITVFVVKFNEDDWRSARVRAKRLNEAKDAKDIYAEGILADACDYCKWKEACGAINKAAVPTKERKEAFTEEQKIELRKLAIRERQLDAQMKALKEEKDDVRADLKDMLAMAQTKTGSGEDFKVTWTWQNGRETLDQKAMEEAGIDLTDFKKKGAGFEKLTVTVKEATP